MQHPILIENQNSRREVPIWQLLCFVMFCIWQMGFIYFIGPSLNIDGRTPLPVSTDNITLLIVAGYVGSLVVMCLLPQWVIRLSRASTAIALLTALGLFLSLDAGALTALIYIQCFCCCFMIGFETATMVYFFSENSAMRHLLLAYPFGYAVVAVVQNDFVKIDFASFRILTVIMLALLLVFFCKMPTKSCPRFVKKEDGLIAPKRFFTGVFLLSFLSMLLGVIGPAVAAQFEHGVFVAYMSCAVCTLAVYSLHKLTRHHPLQMMPYVIGIAVVGYVLLYVSNYQPGLALVACALIGAGMTTCLLVPLFGVLLAKQYPSKFIAPGIIFLAMLAVIVQSVLVEAFRSQAVLLNLTYLVIVVVLAFIFILVEPYLIYAMRRRFADAPDGEAAVPVLAAEQAAAPLPDASVRAEAGSRAATVAAAPPVSSPLALLTKREREVLDLIGCGHSNVDIAQMLFISENTVKDHTKSIYRKLGVHSRHAAAQMVNRQEEQPRNSSDT
ncbi:MAG: response regulator transcription factor [Ruminococcus sp.]